MKCNFCETDIKDEFLSNIKTPCGKKVICNSCEELNLKLKKDEDNKRTLTDEDKTRIINYIEELSNILSNLNWDNYDDTQIKEYNYIINLLK